MDGWVGIRFSYIFGYGHSISIIGIHSITRLNGLATYWTYDLGDTLSNSVY